MASGEVYGFGEFTLDAAERRFSRAGEEISLPPKAFGLLLVLLRQAGHLVTKRELLDAVWPESFVEEGILAVHISTLRKTINGGKGYIETVSRSGYRFNATVSRNPAPVETPRDMQVYELFGHGRAHLLAHSIHEIPKAIRAFERAIELDPGYAAAHAGLALAYCALAAIRSSKPLEAYGNARAAALRALAMDPQCADAQAALGAVLFFCEWSWAAAERCLQRALQANPNHTEALLLYGQLLEALGRLEAGIECKLKALERDPHSPLVHLQISMSYWHQRRFDKAIEWARKTLALDSGHPHAREHLAASYLKTGDFDSYLEENIRHAEAHGVSAEAMEPVRQAHEAAGIPGIRRLILKRAEQQPEAFPAMQLAIFHGEEGNRDAAFMHLERAIASHDPCLVHLAIAPQWDSLRGDPRFDRCLDRMGLVGRS